MEARENMPLYMIQLLDQLGWNQGTRIPLADLKNQELENILINRLLNIYINTSIGPSNS